MTKRAVRKDSQPKPPKAAVTTEPKPPGRPPGSTNKEYAPVEEVPAACIKCQSPSLTRVAGSKVITHRIAGTTRGGFKFNVVSHTRKKCGGCGQILIVKSYYRVAGNDSIPEN